MKTFFKKMFNINIENSSSEDTASSYSILELVQDEIIEKQIDNHINTFPHADNKFDPLQFDYNESSKTNNQLEYNTNIKKISCTCKDWKETRKQYDMDDPRRLCKHLIKELTPEVIVKKYPYFQESIYFYKDKNIGFKRDVICLKKFNEYELKMLMGYDWNDIFDKNGKRYGYKFYYNEKEHVWSQNEKPNNYQYIENFFENIPVQASYLSQTEIEKLAQYIQYREGYINYQFSIEYDTMYILPPNILYYSFDYKFQSEIGFHDNEIEGIYVTPKYIKIISYDKDIYYQRMQSINKDSSVALKWQNYEEWKDTRHENMISYSTNKIDFFNSIEKFDVEENLIKEFDAKITPQKFHIRMKKLGLMDNPYYNWIFTEEGLIYGYNILIGRSHYNSDDITTYSYDKETKKFTIFSETEYSESEKLLYPTSRAIFNIEKFLDVIELVKEFDKPKIKIDNTHKFKMDYPPCDMCGSYDIHKKDKRKQKLRTVQRYQCQECRRMFSIEIHVS